MKTLLVIACCALISAPSRSLASGRTAISFHPAEGLELVKTFELEFDIELDEMTVSVGGQEMPMDEVEMRWEMQETSVVTDTYVAMGDGRPTRLRRTFDTLMSTELTEGTMAEDTEELGTSELEGETVLFVWDADEEEFGVSFEDSAADEALLDGLEENMDLRGFLPEGEVEEGDSWEYEATDLDRLLTIGGDLEILTEDETGEEDDDDIDDAFENLEGSLTCTYAGDRDVDGRRLAMIEIEAFLTGSAEDDEGATMALDLELEGHLAWDLEAGVFASFLLEGSLLVEIEQADEEMEMSLSMTGELSLSGEVEEL